MAKKTARAYTLDELKEKSQQALCYRRLREIVQTAPLNNDGKINLSWVDRESEKYIHEENEQIGDLQTIEKLRKSTRALAMLRRQFTEEFEKLIAQEHSGEKIKTEEVYKRLFWKTEFPIPENTTLITRELNNNRTHALQFKSRSGGNDRPDIEQIIGFCQDILETLCESSNVFRHDLAHLDVALIRILGMLEIEKADSDRKMFLLNHLIQLLEEKFGLKVKVCGNCEYYVIADGQHGEPLSVSPEGFCLHNRTYTKFGNRGNFLCDHEFWTPKELPEKPSSA